MAKCPMCSQEVLTRGRICQECEWELESARAWAENQDARDAARAAASPEHGIASAASIDGDADAAPAPVALAGVGSPPEVVDAVAATSYNLWRTRRGAALLLAIAGVVVLVGIAALGPVTPPAQASLMVAQREAGMLPHCSEAVPAHSCLPSPPH